MFWSSVWQHVVSQPGGGPCRHHLRSAWRPSVADPDGTPGPVCGQLTAGWRPRIWRCVESLPETTLPIPDGTCSKWLYCRLGGDPSLPRSSDYIASYIPTGLLQHWYQLQVRAHASAALNWSSGTRIAVWQLSFDTCVDARLWGPDSSKLGNPSARVVASALIICYLIKYISDGVWLCVYVDLFSLFVSAVANCQIFQDGAHCLLGRGKFEWGVNGLQFQNGNRFGTQRRQWY